VKARGICETRLEVGQSVQCAKGDTLAFRAALECRTFRKPLFLRGLRREQFMKSFLSRSMKRFGKVVLAAAALGGFLVLGATPRAVADDDACRHRLVKADHRLHEAAEHHGWNSPQAEHARHELHEAREYCWGKFHKWWDEDGHRWHTERDWDDHDHDHDRDHDH